MQEHDRVVLTVDLDGKTASGLTVPAEQLRDVRDDELIHAAPIRGD